MVGLRGEAPLVPPYRLPKLKKALALRLVRANVFFKVGWQRYSFRPPLDTVRIEPDSNQPIALNGSFGPDSNQPFLGTD